MLAMADQYGRVWASVPGLANRARVPLEDAQKALDAFLSPDPYSRTPDFEGRRIEPIDGGWRLLNHEKYRAIRDEESIKESKRKYINARRAAERGGVENSRTLSNSVDAGRANAEADTEADKEPNGSVGGADRLPRCDTQSLVDIYHEILPEMPRVRLMTDARRKALSSFWKFVLTSRKTDGSKRAETAAEATEWVRGYFTRARDNDFLMGRGAKAPGHEGWSCDLDFLLTDKGKRHVIEKTKEHA